MTFFRNAILASTLAATALATATPAMARDHYRHNDNTAAVAIGAGVIGLALGAIIASNNNDDRYRDDRYYNTGYAYGPAYTSGWEYRDGWYWDRQGGRHSRNDYDRYQRGDYRRGYDHDRGDFRRGY
ncbi:MULTISPECIES: hypothetical protein [Novosphingobium]|uniref:Uncharacterized protein n=1 Tax=Novosphingobium pentaromativorans TaxID=205844 RepID=A0A2W5QHG1_9SPHN|nr:MULTISPECIES: hypothetical protein [Novosphingobium]PZQ57147.1 MAG: hypothetical protein DI555_03290 [Novosphingobium pentaromativorans]GFE74159.1 hypothetical protein NTCA1_18080 [Novosphingobium sp. TCA1]